MTCSLCSAGITPASTLLRSSPPLTGASKAGRDPYQPFEWQFDRASNELRFAPPHIWCRFGLLSSVDGPPNMPEGQR